VVLAAREAEERLCQLAVTLVSRRKRGGGNAFFIDELQTNLNAFKAAEQQVHLIGSPLIGWNLPFEMICPNERRNTFVSDIGLSYSCPPEYSQTITSIRVFNRTHTERSNKACAEPFFSSFFSSCFSELLAA
jgi:hypothetical protein